MNTFFIKNMRSVVSPYTHSNNTLAISMFLLDITFYALAIITILLVDSYMIKISAAIFAGLRIGTLFLISHDSAHDSFTSYRTLNRIIGRISFLPAFHNYSLWLIAHNREHHQAPNVKGRNSWSPMSKEEFDQLPKWRQLLERHYRSPLGASLNYTIERWWKDKFYPYKRIMGKRERIHWLDFALVTVYMLAFVSMLVVAGMTLATTTVTEALIFGLVVPFVVSNFLIGFTVYQHHTHETIPWFLSGEDSRQHVNQEDITVNVIYPNWYNMISNNAMIHTVHHVDPRVPLYHTPAAQALLNEKFPDKIINIPFSLTALLTTFRKCKLYDYNRHCWLDFEGNPASESLIVERIVELEEAA